MSKLCVWKKETDEVVKDIVKHLAEDTNYITANIDYSATKGTDRYRGVYEFVYDGNLYAVYEIYTGNSMGGCIEKRVLKDRTTGEKYEI